MRLFFTARAYSLKLRKPVFVLGPLESGKKETDQWHKGDYPKLQMSLGALQGYYMVILGFLHCHLNKSDVISVVL